MARTSTHEIVVTLESGDSIVTKRVRTFGSHRHRVIRLIRAGLIFDRDDLREPGPVPIYARGGTRIGEWRHGADICDGPVRVEVIGIEVANARTGRR